MRPFECVDTYSTDQLQQHREKDDDEEQKCVVSVIIFNRGEDHLNP
jgi:hypothetical protein